MAIGKNQLEQSPIIEAIRDVESRTTAEVRVHLTRKWFEKDPYRHAWRLFDEFGMSKTTHRNAVLVYVNLRRRKFAVIGDSGFHSCLSEHYWEKIGKDLSANLRATHPEKAIAMTVRTIGDTLVHFFPLDPKESNPNELGDEVSRD